MTTEKINKKKLFVNENCIGCSACTTICPEVFDMNDE
ncbi:MAG: ferredoxin [Candidatus Peribacteria bacterium]|jgi:ferredoxin|nr:ferredoxin [Candidatus Peribacteria bacterium]